MRPSLQYGKTHPWLDTGRDKWDPHEVQMMGWIVSTEGRKKGILPWIIKGKTFRIGASFEREVSSTEVDWDVCLDHGGDQPIVGVYLPRGNGRIRSTTRMLKYHD